MPLLSYVVVTVPVDNSCVSDTENETVKVHLPLDALKFFEEKGKKWTWDGSSPGMYNDDPKDFLSFQKHAHLGNCPHQISEGVWDWK